MSPDAAVSVPGKAILLGEHAAVYGHPALVTAVDLRLTVVARPASGPVVTVGGSSGFRTGTMPRDEAVDLFRSAEPPGDRLAYLAAAAALAHAAPAGTAGLELRVDSEIPPGSGLGSSAALAVGVVAAVFAALGVRADAATLARVAKEVETRQHGRPSGVDVEAVLRGGTLWCERPAGGALTCLPLAPAPGPLSRLELYHAGTPDESTGEMVAAVARRLEESPGGVRAAMDEIDAATRDGREAIASGDAARLAGTIRRAGHALETLGVVPEPVVRAIRAIERAGGVAKVSGAGGRRDGAGLVIVMPGEGGAPIPSAWRRLPCALGAPGLLQDVAA